MAFPDISSLFGKKKVPEHKLYSQLSQNIIWASENDAKEVLKKVQSRASGLSPGEARGRLRRYGENRPVRQKKISKWERLVDAYSNPLNLLLTLLAVISYFTEDLASALIIVVMVSVAVVLRFIQEVRADEAAEKLKAMVRTTTTVIRDGRRKEIPLANVVPGDLVFLSAGDLVPADARIIDSKDLFLNQSALTGESMPAEKHAQTLSKETRSPFEIQNMAYMGTNVESGSATAVVLLTGTNTYFGAISERVVRQQGVTEFDRGVQGFTSLMIKFMLVMVPLVFLINAISKGNILEAFLFGVSVAVGLTPEMLPMVVTANLAKGAVSMARHKMIVKKLRQFVKDFLRRQQSRISGARDDKAADLDGWVTVTNGSGTSFRNTPLAPLEIAAPPLPRPIRLPEMVFSRAPLPKTWIPFWLFPERTLDEMTLPEIVGEANQQPTPDPSPPRGVTGESGRGKGR